MCILPDLDTQWDPGSRIPRPSSPTSSAGPAPAPATWSRVWGTRSAVAVDTEEASGGVRETEAAHAGPRTSAASSRIHDGIARAAIRQPACSTAVQQLQLPRSEQLPDFGHCGTPRRARAHRPGQGHRSQRFQEKHTACGTRECVRTGSGMGLPGSSILGLPEPSPSHSLQPGTSASANAMRVPCGVPLPPCGSPGKQSS